MLANERTDIETRIAELKRDLGADGCCLKQSNANLSGPRVETDHEIISVGSQREYASVLDRALQLATADMMNWLVDGYQLEPWAAHALVTTQARYEVVTVAGSMALKIPKRYLPQR